MRYFKLAVIIISLSSVFPVKNYGQSTNSNFSVEVNFGYHMSELDWSIAGNIEGEKPNVLSELKWNRLNGTISQMALNYSINRFYIYSKYYYGNYLNGFVTDSDYLRDNRQSRISHEHYKSDKGYEYGIEPRIGFKYIQNQKYVMSVYAGFSTARQLFYLLDNNLQQRERVSRQLSSTYSTKWNGIVIGLTSKVTISKSLKIKIDASSSLQSFTAKANWNLIEGLAHPVSFTQSSPTGNRFYGSVLSIIPLKNRTSVLLRIDGTIAKANIGLDRLYYKTGKTFDTRFNGANYINFRIQGGIEISLQ